MTVVDEQVPDSINLPVPSVVLEAARRAYPEHRRRRQCSRQDFESGYIAFWVELQQGEAHRMLDHAVESQSSEAA